MRSTILITTICLTTLLTVSASAKSPEQQCRAALKFRQSNPYPTPLERQAEIAAVQKAFTLCRSRSMAPDLRAASVERWAQILSQRDLAATEAMYRETIREVTVDHGPNAPALLTLQHGLLAVVNRASGGPTAESFGIAYDIQRIAEEAHGAQSEPYALALATLAHLHEWNGSRAAAEELYREAIATASAACGPKCGTLSAMYSILRDLIKDDPARKAEADELNERATEALPDDEPQR
ncbi:MAG TPA: hypothetical protein VGQ36_15385 [Thermoanaerobaculia bacterium]|jgi:hypothetical protein|nr:hypothetical protein [Thermoanaerobaculia bacterium]